MGAHGGCGGTEARRGVEDEVGEKYRINVFPGSVQGQYLRISSFNIPELTRQS